MRVNTQGEETERERENRIAERAAKLTARYTWIIKFAPASQAASRQQIVQKKI